MGWVGGGGGAKGRVSFALPSFARGAAGSDAMRVTTYNLLCSSCSATPSVFEEQAGGFPHNLWANRLPAIRARLQDLDSDVFLLQEVTEHMLMDIRQGNPHMAQYAVECTRGNRGGLECAICYKRSRLVLIRRIEYEFRALTTVLRSRHGDAAPFAITSCHLKAGEDRRNDVIRERQARTIVQTMEVSGCVHQIIGGDLNSDRRLWCYYQRRPQALDVVEQSGFSAHSDTADTFYGWSKLKLDYIYAKALEFASPHEAAAPLAPGPSPSEPSDHVPLSAMFKL